MPAGRMKATFAQASIPAHIDWKTVPPRWISLANVRLDGGFYFTKATVQIESLFHELWTEPTPRLLDIDGRLYVITGETTVIRAILDGAAGFEALVARA